MDKRKNPNEHFELSMKYWASQAEVQRCFFVPFKVPAEAYRERDPCVSDKLTFNMDWFKTELIPSLEKYNIINL